MALRTIHLTAGEARAILHRLESWDCLRDVFADTDGLEHLAEPTPDRAEYMARELRNNGYVHVDPASELDREILVECVEGSTWPAIHHPDNDTNNTRQAHAGACRCLHGAKLKIADAFGLDPHDIEFPQA
jgi:hypothetical protein